MQNRNGIFGRPPGCLFVHVFGWHHRIDLGWNHLDNSLACRWIVSRGIRSWSILDELGFLLNALGGIGIDNGGTRRFVECRLGLQKFLQSQLCSVRRLSFVRSTRECHVLRLGFSSLEVFVSRIHGLVRVCPALDNSIVRNFSILVYFHVHNGTRRVCCTFLRFEVGVSHVARILSDVDFGKGSSVVEVFERARNKEAFLFAFQRW
mmetsp:Transcript_15458/g.38953  ORF Transcript_15458/g.38953 Transcript_15458/m.38953 type:complete len:206 (+) Transcript_15458:784-1401(+)